MANKKKYKEPFRVIFLTDTETVGRLDGVALNQSTSRTTVINKAIDQYLKRVK